MSMLSSQEPTKCLDIMDEALHNLKDEILKAHKPEDCPARNITHLQTETENTVYAWLEFIHTIEQVFINRHDKTVMELAIEEGLVRIEKELRGGKQRERREKREAEEQAREGKGKERAYDGK
ncbi:hypothetical protein AA313_de0206407 [Arthrobotrys entomopaga]|nr:hypothetical protein AA313_de0206407 [Arthrobotrys entomopaga]